MELQDSESKKVATLDKNTFVARLSAVDEDETSTTTLALCYFSSETKIVANKLDSLDGYKIVLDSGETVTLSGTQQDIDVQLWKIGITHKENTATETDLFASEDESSSGSGSTSGSGGSSSTTQIKVTVNVEWPLESGSPSTPKVYTFQKSESNSVKVSDVISKISSDSIEAEGYTIKGLATSSTSEDVVATSTEITSDKTFYIVWEEDNA